MVIFKSHNFEPSANFKPFLPFSSSSFFCIAFVFQTIDWRTCIEGQKQANMFYSREPFIFDDCKISSNFRHFSSHQTLSAKNFLISRWEKTYGINSKLIQRTTLQKIGTRFHVVVMDSEFIVHVEYFGPFLRWINSIALITLIDDLQNPLTFLDIFVNNKPFAF